MSSIKNLQLFVTLLAIFSGCFSKNCNLDSIKNCLRNPENDIRDLQHDPFRTYVLDNIRKTYTSFSTVNCETILNSLPESCTAYDKAPYIMLLETIGVLEVQGITSLYHRILTFNEGGNIVGTGENAAGLGRYESFFSICILAQCRVVMEGVLETRNIGFNKTEVNCRLHYAYEQAKYCVEDQTVGYPEDSKDFIHELLLARTKPWTDALNCTTS